MTVSVEGVVRHRKVVGFGPFRRESWSGTPFSWTVREPNLDYETVASSLCLTVEKIAGVVLVKALIGGIEAHLFHTKEGCSAFRRFAFVSVAGIEVNGRVEIEAEESDLIPLPIVVVGKQAGGFIL